MNNLDSSSRPSGYSKHNDLHLGNIMLQTLEEPQEFHYEIDGKIVSFKTTKIVKIIDYDRSSIYHSDVERNGFRLSPK